MFINFYSVLTVSYLSNMLKFVLLLPSDFFTTATKSVVLLTK